MMESDGKSGWAIRFEWLSRKSLPSSAKSDHQEKS
jgi:hypothetical protein